MTVDVNDLDIPNVARRLAQAGHGLMPSIDGLPGIFSGTAAPTFSAAPGSLYLRQNGSSSVPYVNTSTTNPGTTWSAVTVP